MWSGEMSIGSDQTRWLLRSSSFNHELTLTKLPVARSYARETLGALSFLSSRYTLLISRLLAT